MSAVRAVVVHLVESRRVLDAERPVRVLAVQAFLVSVHHGLPVEVAGVLDRPAMRQAPEVVAGQQFEKGCWKPFRELWG